MTTGFTQRLAGMCLLAILFANSLSAQNQQQMAERTKTAGLVELTEFNLSNGVSEEAFLQAAERMQQKFLDRQPGFIQRVLVKGEDGTWTDVVFWTDHAALERAMQQAETSEAAAPFMQMIDFSSVQMRTGTVSFMPSR